MKSFYDKEDYTIEDIQSLIDNQVEESIYLDFKSAGSLAKDDRKRMELSKDVASFANSDGGIIIYGIKEVNHVASEFSFIDGNEFTKEWIEQVITSYVQRRISDVKIYPVRIDSDIKKSIYVVKIPYSFDAPHLSKDNRYYKRFNFMSVPMEEYEIRQSYGRKKLPKLIINGYSASIKVNEVNVTVSFDLSIYNQGQVVESSYKLNSYFIGMHKGISFNWPQTSTENSYTLLGNGRVKISSVNKAPIYPNETVDVCRFDMLIEKSSLDDALENLSLELRLYYSGPEDYQSYDLNELIANIKQKATKLLG